jgi:hypothetical protein
MAKGFKHGAGGGSSLNFKVIGNPKPETAKENTIWVDTDTPITSWDFSATQPHRRSGTKNLIPYPYVRTTHTIFGITYTDNGDGTITANGTSTSTENAPFILTDVKSGADTLILTPGVYTLSGAPYGYDGYVYMAVFYVNGEHLSHIGSANCYTPFTFTITETAEICACIYVANGLSVTNAVFKPQIEKGSVATSFIKGDATGQVWFPTGTSSPVAFSATKKNSIMVYPLSAKQCVGGTWVDKTAKSWQGGKWVDWITYLYNMGNECTDITGGWKSLAHSGYTYDAKNTAEGLYEKKTSNKGAYPSNWYTNNMIDVTDISVIHAKILATVAIDTWIRIIITRNNTDLENEYLAWVNVNYTNANELVQIDLDVSAFSGNYYIKLNHQGGSNAEVFWKEVWFE